MKSQVNQEQRAYKAWEILIEQAAAHQFITYKELGRRIGIHHRAVRYALSEMQSYCMDNNLPPLTILVVNQSTGKPGQGFIAWDIENSDDGVQKVYDYNWSSIQNPFEYAASGLKQSNFVEELIENPTKSKDVFIKVRSRGIAQVIFRKALLKVYDYSCCFCGLSFENVLEASHIIPYSKSHSSQRLDLTNGLLLCANHHKLFDQGYITVNPDYTLNYYDPDKEEGPYNNYDELNTIRLHGQKLQLPSDKKYYPNTSYLKQHQESFNE